MNSTSDSVHLSEHGEALSTPLVASGAASVGSRGQDDKRHWYALRTYQRHEKRVCEYLQSRSIQCFLPLYMQAYRWKNGCKGRVELPLFPGYLFVEIDSSRRGHVLEPPGAISLVGSTRELWPIPDSAIQILRDSLHLRKCEPHPYLVAGVRVRIISGPLASMTGILVRKNSDLRVVVTLDQVMQGVAVEVDASEIESATSSIATVPCPS
jgi:transcriptional antiterminator NusG